MYTLESRVRYSEVSRDGTLDLSAVINYMQDCSTFQSESLGLGVNHMREQNRVWLMNAWQLQIERLPELSEQITVGTWSYGFKSMYGYRNFVMDDAEGHHLVKANSIWVFYDWKNKRPVKVPEEEVRAYGSEPRLEMEYADRKIAVPEGGTALEPFPVRRYQIDTNGHVNNGQYIRMAQECVPGTGKVDMLRAEYRKSAVYGDVIYPILAETEDGYVVSLKDRDGAVFAVVALQMRERCAVSEMENTKI